MGDRHGHRKFKYDSEQREIGLLLTRDEKGKSTRRKTYRNRVKNRKTQPNIGV